MKLVHLKNNILLIAFNNVEKCNLKINVLLAGDVNSIDNQIVSKYVEKMSFFTEQYRAYDKDYSHYYDNAMDSFLSACNGFEKFIIFIDNHFNNTKNINDVAKEWWQSLGDNVGEIADKYHKGCESIQSHEITQIWQMEIFNIPSKHFLF